MYVRVRVCVCDLPTLEPGVGVKLGGHAGGSRREPESLLYDPAGERRTAQTPFSFYPS